MERMLCHMVENKSEIVRIHPMVGNFPGGSDSKASAFNARDPGLIPGSGRSPGEGNGNPLQYSCLKKSHGQRSLAGMESQKCQTRLSY